MFLNALSQGWVIAVVAGGVSILFGLALMRVRKNAAFNVRGVKKKVAMLKTFERRFFETLCDALDHDYVIFAKVPVLEVVEPARQVGVTKAKQLNRDLSSFCFDYVICRKNDFSVIAVVELECFDKNVPLKEKQHNSAVVGELCKAAKLKLFFFDVRQDYSGVDIRRLITGSSRCTPKSPPAEDVVKHTTKQKVLTNADTAAKTDCDSPSLLTEHIGQTSCPQCYSQLVTKVAVKGSHVGERFLMCKKYPYCDYRVLLSDAKIVSLQSNSTSQVSEPIAKGYSDWSG